MCNIVGKSSLSATPGSMNKSDANRLTIILFGATIGSG
jgi:hypothetical protein